MQAYRRVGLVMVVCLLGGLAVVAQESSNESGKSGKVTKYARFQVGQTVAYRIVKGDRVPQLDGGLAVVAQEGNNESGKNGKITKYARFQVGQTVAYGIVEGDRVRRLDGDLYGTWSRTDKTYALAEVKLLAPSTPTKVLALAGNYKSHLQDAPVPKNPEVFFKVPSCVLPTGENIVIPKGADPAHYEAEMVIVIGRRAKDVPKDKALDYVLGVTCGNDVSARDWQSNDRQWWRAKGSDTFGPCGPFVVSGINYDDLLLELRLNGEVKQRQRTKDLIFDVAEVVSFISRYVTLEPGDLIYTGTTGTTEPMKPGDVVEVELEGVGVLKNGVAAGQ